MGRYFNPPNRDSVISRGGTPIARKSTHSELVAQVPEGFRLGIHLDRFAFQQIADVTDPREYKEFWDQVGNGIVIFKGFYAIPEAEFRPT